MTREYIITEEQLQKLIAVEISANDLIELSQAIRSRPVQLERKT